MANEKDHTRKTINKVEGAVEKFADGMESSQRMILRETNSVIRELETTTDGRVKINRANLKVLRALEDNIRSLIITPAYRKKLDKYLANFTRIRRSNDAYFLDLLSGYNPNKQAFKTILNTSLDLTKNSLLDAGINVNVVDPIIKITKQGITSGMFISDIEEALRVDIIGDPDGTITGTKRQGQLLRYTSQITRDSLNQFTRNYVTAVSEEYGMEWYYYDGSVIADTRSYCKQRAGKYFHKKEVEKSAKKSWPGKIPNTNRSTIFTYCGGYNCRHEYLPVLIDVVPKSVIKRNIKAGNIKKAEG